MDKCGIDTFEVATTEDVFKQAFPRTLSGQCAYECMLRITRTVRTSFKSYIT